MAHRLLLDTSSLMYRAFFAIPDSIKDPRGRPVNALRGYLDMTARLIRERRPDEVVHCFDHDWRPAPRVEAYDGYKATRAPEPEGLGHQFEVLKPVLDATGMTQAEAPGWEAEDAIGTLCARGGRSDRADIVTGDRDLLQLVRDGTARLLFTRRGVSELEEFDEAAVRAKYGIPPDRYAEFAVLRGDPSDGLPGVKGVGEKTARELVRTYDSLEEMLADARRPTRHREVLRPPALRARLVDAVEYLEAMRRVVPIRTDLEVRTWRGSRDDEALERLGKTHAIESPIGRLREALDGAA